MHVTCGEHVMAIQRYDGLSSPYASGNRAGDFIAKLADKAADLACGLHRDYPGFTTYGGIVPGSGVVSEFNKGIWDSLCNDRGGLPPAATPPFTGGQCSCVRYTVVIQQTTWDGVTSQFTRFNVPGAIKGISQKPISETDPRIQSSLVAGEAACPYDGGIESAPAGRESKFNIVSVARNDGLADNCGSPPSRYPDVEPPFNRTYGNDSITYNDGTDFTFPFFYVPVDISPTFSPNIRIDLGGFTFNFDLGGVDIYLPDKKDDPRALPPAGGYPTAPPSGLPRPQPDPNRPNPNPDPGNKPPRQDCPDCPDIPPQPDPPGEGDPPEERPEEEGEEVTKPGIEFLEVVLTTLPDKVHYGNEGANVVFAGWVAFRSKSGSYYPREQINFQQSVFRAPVGADGYTYTFTNGARGFVREY